MTPLLAALVVLMYHRVAPDVPKTAVGLQLTVAPPSFATQLDELQRRRVHVYTTDEAARLVERGERIDGVVLTFDDGRADGYDVVLPMLQRHGMHASFYVNSSTIDGPFHMTWRELRAMRAAGNEIGCHGHEHLDLSQLSADAQEREIGRCLDRVEHHAGARPRTYAYAAGRYDATTRRLMLRDRIEAALTEIPGDVDPTTDRTQWPRRRVNRETTLEEFRALIADASSRRAGTRR